MFLDTDKSIVRVAVGRYVNTNYQFRELSYPVNALYMATKLLAICKIYTGNERPYHESASLSVLKAWKL